MAKLAPHKALNEKQFEELFQLHFQFMCNFAYQYVQDKDIAQDLTQKVFITLWEKRAEIDPKLSVKSYLFTILKNRCLNHIRDHNKYRSKVLDVDGGDIDIAVEDTPMSRDELAQQIERALDTLPQKCREVFEMSRYRGLKYKEIAEELNISPKTVEAHMSKAIKSLREQLKDYFILIILFGINI